MEARPVKLIKSSTDQQFYMLHDQQIGRGGSGQVFRAVDLNNPNKNLVVKVIPIKQQYSRISTERQLDVISQLPDNPHLVRTWPIRCFSEKNYYIFMEYCQGGTLGSEMKAKLRQGYSEDEILSIIYQLIVGYKILKKYGIVHLDIKPDNILIQNGVYKYADFGLAAIQAASKSVRRQGTKSYMAPQRFTTQAYIPDPLSDMYSLGIMFYLLMAGHHPYVSAKSLDCSLRDFVLQLLTVPCCYPQTLALFSLEFRQVVDMVMGMIQRNPAKRSSYQNVLQFVEGNRLFEKFKKMEYTTQSQKQENTAQYDFVIKDYTQIEVTPLKPPEVEQLKPQEVEVDLLPINEFIISRRVMICFFDRLIRRLSLKKQEGDETQYMLIFGLLQLIQRLQVEMIHEFKNCQLFEKTKWEAFRSGNQKQLIDMIERDYSYIQYEIEDFLKQRVDIDPQIVANSRIIFRSSFQSCFECIADKLKIYFAQSCRFLDESSRVSLTTVLYLIRAFEIATNPDAWLKDYHKLQQFDYESQTKKRQQLVVKIVEQAPMLGAEIIGVDITGEDEKPEQSTLADSIYNSTPPKPQMTQIIDDYE